MGRGSDDEKKGAPDGAAAAAAAAAQPPPGIAPIYLTEKTLTRWGMRTGSGVDDVVGHCMLPKQQLLDELQQIGFMCDFYEQRDTLKAFAGEQILLVRDAAQRYDQNFYWCSTLEAFESERARIERAEAAAAAKAKAADGGADDAEAADDAGDGKEAPELEDKAFVPGAWASLGSEAEVELMRPKRRRALLGMTIARRRKDMGAHADFNDLDPPDKPPEFRRQKLAGCDSERSTLERGFQSASATCEGAAQTRAFRQVSKALQSEAVVLDEVSRTRVLHSSELAAFVARAAPLCAEALEQNALVDPFRDELAGLDDEEATVSGKAEVALRGLHTFTHLRFSKGRSVADIHWHPSRSGVMLAACTCNESFDAWVEASGVVRTSHVLVWNFRDVLQPEVVLEAPGHVQCLAVNSDPDIVAAGLRSGQIVLWDLREAPRSRAAQSAQAAAAAAAGPLQQRGDDATGRRDSAAGAEEEEEAAAAAAAATATQQQQQQQPAATQRGNGGSGGGGSEAPEPLKPKLVSVVDRSHSRPVTDLAWLPAGVRVRRSGEVLSEETRGEANSLLLSVAADGNAMFWNILDPTGDAAKGRGPASPTAPAGSSGGGGGGGGGGGNSKSDEARWLPVFSLLLTRPGSGAPLDLVRVSLSHDRRMVATTEDGEVAFCDWGARGGAEEKGRQSVERVLSGHTHPCVGVARSPHFPELFATVGGCTFAVWREGLDVPIFSSPPAAEALTCVAWSPTRPAVLVVGRADGSLDVWDLLDQSHREALCFSAAQAAVSSVAFWQSRASSQQLLAVGDADGHLHVLDVPRALRRRLPREDALIRRFFEREASHLEYSRRAVAPPSLPAAAAAAASADGSGAGAASRDAAAGGEAESKDEERAQKEYEALLLRWREELTGDG